MAFRYIEWASTYTTLLTLSAQQLIWKCMIKFKVRTVRTWVIISMALTIRLLNELIITLYPWQ